MMTKVMNSVRRGDRLFIFALLMSAATGLLLLSNYHCISVDGVRYIAAARNLYAGDVKAALSRIDPPGYPLLIAVVYPFLGDWELAGQAVSFSANILLLVVLYRLLTSMYDRGVALLGCSLAAINPYLARYAVHVRTESLFFLLAIAALYVSYCGIERRKPLFFLYAGLIAGFAYLVKPEAIGFLILVPGILLLRWRLKRDWDLRSIGKAGAALLAGFVVFAAPYVVYLSKQTGQWGMISRKAGITLAVSLQEADLLDAEIAQEFPTRGSMSLPEFVRRHPLTYTKKVFYDIFPSIGTYFEALHYSYVPFLLIGLIVAFREKPWERRDFILLLYVVFFAALFVAVFVNRRYSVQLVPVSMGWTALGVLSSWSWLRRALSPKAALYTAAVVAFVFLAGTLPKTLKPVAREKAYLKDAALYLKERRGAAGFPILVVDQRIAFYADARGIPLHRMSESDFVVYLRERRAEFLAAEPHWLRRHFPTVLKGPEAYGLRFEREFVGSQGDRLFVYRVA
jgi:4-amino-4-deoxy-L-arabinose transferase-like glycosyltransferase